MTDPIERITSAAVPAPAGHYSHATAWRDLIFVSGQLGPRSDGAHPSAEPFEVQVHQALANVFAIQAGSRMRTRSRAAGDSLQRRRRELARL